MLVEIDFRIARQRAVDRRSKRRQHKPIAQLDARKLGIDAVVKQPVAVGVELDKALAGTVDRHTCLKQILVHVVCHVVALIDRPVAEGDAWIQRIKACRDDAVGDFRPQSELESRLVVTVHLRYEYVGTVCAHRPFYRSRFQKLGIVRLVVDAEAVYQRVAVGVAFHCYLVETHVAHAEITKRRL